MKTKVKEGVYLSLWVFTGIFFALFVGGFVVLLLSWLGLNLADSIINWILLGTSLAGGLAGVILGPIAWKKIYIEGARGEKYVVKEKKKAKK